MPFTIAGLIVKARDRVVPSTRDGPPGWHADPLRHHQGRYWDGDQWTAEVSDSGVTGVDPLAP